MLYAAKCYWPGVTETEIEPAVKLAARAGSSSSRDRVAYLGPLTFTADDLVLCLFEGPSRVAVKRARDGLGIPSERIMDAAWLQPDRARTEGIER